MVDRVGYVVIKREDGKLYKLGTDELPLDFKFTIERKAGAIACFADVSVCGMKREDVLLFTAFAAKWREMNKHKSLLIYAGYEDEGGAQLLFDGEMYNALPTMPPEVWVNMKARTCYDLQLTKCEKSILTPTKIEDVCRTAANWMGKKLLWMVKKAETNAIVIPQFRCKGTLSELAKQMQDLAPEKIIVSVNEKTGCVEIVDIDDIHYSASMMTITKESGLIGMPTPNPWGVEFDMRLCPSIKRFMPIHLESEMIPLLNGDYAVSTYKHSGHLRGNEWKTHIMARRIDIYNHGK